MMKEYKRGKTPVEEAIGLIEGAIRGPERTRRLPLLEALNHVLAVDVTANLPQPPFTRSPVDGYAVRAHEIAEANGEQPVVLPVKGFLAAGSREELCLEPGTAIRIMTGAPLPEGADCVVPQEFTDQGEERVAFFRPVAAGGNVCYAGEDIAAGACLVPQGTRLTFAHLGVLAGQGIRRVDVYEGPRVAVMATGDELAPLGAPLGRGQIYDSNSLMLCARLKELGIEADMYPSGADDPQALSDSVDRLLREYELVITTGGVSVGKKDYMPLVAELVGTRLLFHGIGAKPGSPVLAAVRGGSVLLALSGNPFASIATFELLALPVLARLRGDRFWRPIKSRARLHGSFEKPSKIRRFIRARLEGGNVYIPEKGHSSGGIGTLAGCNCLIDVAAGSGPLHDGDEVQVWLF